MLHRTYNFLRNAYLGNVEKSDMYESMSHETDPYLHSLLKDFTQANPAKYTWDESVFTTDFRNGDPKTRLHQTVMAFLMRLTIIVKNQLHYRSFFKPASHKAMQGWLHFLKLCITTLFTLLYNVKWNMELLYELDQVLFDLIFEGKASALREFMNTSLHLDVPETPAERTFENFKYFHIGKVGSSIWRLLHWAAEAMDVRENDADMAFAKQTWRMLLTESFYRVLLCGICVKHMHQIVEELKPQILDEATEQRQLWFNIHNKVTSRKFQDYSHLKEDPLYTQAMLEQDSEFMRQALVQ